MTGWEGGGGRVANESRDRGIKTMDQSVSGAGPFSRERRARRLQLANYGNRLNQSNDNPPAMIDSTAASAVRYAVTSVFCERRTSCVESFS